MRPSRRSRPRPVLTVMLAVAASTTLLLTTLTTGAEAAPPTTRANTDTYSRTGYIAFPENGECIRYTLDGKVTYTALKGPRGVSGDSLRIYHLKDIRLRTPRLRFSTVRYDDVTHGCTSRPAKFKRVSVRQKWAGYSCSYNPSISFSIPRGISLSVWPSCSRKKVAGYSASFDGPDTDGVQLRPDAVVGFASHSYPERSTDPRTGPCYGGVAQFALVTGSTHSTRTSGRAQVCLSPVFR